MNAPPEIGQDEMQAEDALGSDAEIDESKEDIEIAVEVSHPMSRRLQSADEVACRRTIAGIDRSTVEGHHLTLIPGRRSGSGREGIGSVGLGRTRRWRWERKAEARFVRVLVVGGHALCVDLNSFDT